ncbi:MAG: leucine--tRNA ligase [Candidatus Shapirobacteria bacterium]|nr:leucine--tRNA ligase [Candidatus Shapirobacteria bacterium]
MDDAKGKRLTSFGLEFERLEKFWQKRWESENLYQAKDQDKKTKKYVLVEFPYPSGSGLHVGHAFTMTGADVYARKARMAGENVLFPMGWDAFGLPTENYAIAMGKNPQDVTKRNTDTFRRQMKKMAFSFDWSREINTTAPDYYRWTQWIFIKLFKQGLAYKKAMPINWCPDCKIGLANEEVIDGCCERCGAQVFRRKLNQWIVRITDYADRLVGGLETTDFVDKVKAAQVNWVGKSEGARIKFPISNPPAGRAGFQFPNGEDHIEVFTTRPDTLWGATFMVIAPEHPIVALLLSSKLKNQSSERKKVRDYVEKARNKSDLERTDLAKEKTGVFTGLYAINPASKKKIPVWVSDFVLESYGTGAIMAVPAHDERDWQFAKKFVLPIIPVIKPEENWDFNQGAYTRVDQGKIINSDFINGFAPDEAIEKVISWLEAEGVGQRTSNYHLRDWIFSRQHYWGEPIPMVYCEKCAINHNFQFPTRLPDGQVSNFQINSKKQIPKPQKESFEKLKKYAEKEKVDLKVLLDNPGWFPVPEDSLPVKLPRVDKYEPTKTGESPLANLPDWKKIKCPYCGQEAVRETDTMPNWAGSDWYYLAYCFAKRINNPKSKVQSPKSENIFKQSKNILKYWLPVDLYIGGDEHNTLHLLYSRFIYQFLYDLAVVPKEYPEPYYRRVSHGVILGNDGQRMSKSRGNVINPDDKWKQYGVDVLRTYLMFMGPFEATMAWNENALKGVERFLVRFKNLVENQAGFDNKENDQTKQLVHQLIAKVSADIDSFGYNTAIAAMMKTLNSILDKKLLLTKENWGNLIKLLAPFAPYLAEELWCRVLENEFSVHQQSWPTPQKRYLEAEKSTIIVQINGRLRGKIDIKNNILIDKDKIISLVEKNSVVKKHLSGKKIKKVIFIPKKLVNFVV